MKISFELALPISLLFQILNTFHFISLVTWFTMLGVTVTVSEFVFNKTLPIDFGIYSLESC